MRMPKEIPVTDLVDVEQALRTLGHGEMLALAELFEHWALTEDKIDPEQRTRLILMSSDYEAIAEHAGTEWRPPLPIILPGSSPSSQDPCSPERARLAGPPAKESNLQSDNLIYVTPSGMSALDPKRTFRDGLRQLGRFVDKRA